MIIIIIITTTIIIILIIIIIITTIIIIIIIIIISITIIITIIISITITITIIIIIISSSSSITIIIIIIIIIIIMSSILILILIIIIIITSIIIIIIITIINISITITAVIVTSVGLLTESSSSSGITISDGCSVRTVWTVARQLLNEVSELLLVLDQSFMVPLTCLDGRVHKNSSHHVQHLSRKARWQPARTLRDVRRALDIYQVSCKSNQRLKHTPAEHFVQHKNWLQILFETVGLTRIQEVRSYRMMFLQIWQGPKPHPQKWKPTVLQNTCMKGDDNLLDRVNPTVNPTVRKSGTNATNINPRWFHMRQQMLKYFSFSTWSLQLRQPELNPLTCLDWDLVTASDGRQQVLTLRRLKKHPAGGKREAGAPRIRKKQCKHGRVAPRPSPPHRTNSGLERR